MSELKAIVHCSFVPCAEGICTLSLSFALMVSELAGATCSTVPDHGGVDLGAFFVAVYVRIFSSTSLSAVWREASSKW